MLNQSVLMFLINRVQKAGLEQEGKGYVESSHWQSRMLENFHWLLNASYVLFTGISSDRNFKIYWKR